MLIISIILNVVLATVAVRGRKSRLRNDLDDALLVNKWLHSMIVDASLEFQGMRDRFFSDTGEDK